MKRLWTWSHIILTASLIGVTGGSLSAFFLMGLHFVTEFRVGHPWLIYGLPLAGAITGYIYQRWGHGAEKGNQLLIGKISSLDSQHSSILQKIPLRMAPMAFGGTLVTHLFGGSAGREGTAVQMSGAIADHIGFGKHLSSCSFLRSSILMAGIAAGFSSVFGTPLTAVVFAFEVVKRRAYHFETLLMVSIAAWLGHEACLLWGARHSTYPLINVPILGADWNTVMTIIRVSLAGGLFGMLAMCFVWLTHAIKFQGQHRSHNHAYRAAFGGTAVVALTLLLSTNKYLGLGIDTIQNSFIQASSFFDPILKIIFTAITTGSGFQGGEVTPLFYIGATAGSAIAGWLSLDMAFLSAIGFVAVFGAAAQTPIAATVMAYELFGERVIPFALAACTAASLASPHRGLYRSH